MRAFTGLSVWLVLSAGFAVRTASAQTAAPAPPPNRSAARRPDVRISLNAGLQISSVGFTALTATPIYAENSIVNTSYNVTRGPTFDGGVLVRVAGGFHVGLSASIFIERDDGQIAATVPHPFFFNTPRAIEGVAGNLERGEVVTHVQAAYVVPLGRKLDLALSAGPSWFRVKQDMVTGVSFAERYPFDTATYTAASTTRVAANKIGFNAGADLGVRLSKNVGLGGLVRFSRTTVELPLPGAAASLKSRAGGAQAAGGVRLYF